MAESTETSPPIELQELVSFLNHPTVEIRKVAVDAVLKYTATIEGRKLLKACGASQRLCMLLGDHHAIANISVSALINISQEPTEAEKLVKLKLTRRMVTTLLDDEETDSEYINLHCMLLTNLTQFRAGALALLQHEEEKLAGLHVLQLIHLFCTKKIPSRIEDEDNIRYLAEVFANLTQQKEGRDLLSDPKRKLLVMLAPYLHHHNLMRRKGVAKVFRNCAIDSALHYALIDENSGLLPHVLLPLVGREPFRAEEVLTMSSMLTKPKDREEDREVKVLLVEALQALCHSKDGNIALRKIGAYPVMRELYKVEDDELQEAVHVVVDFLLADE
eukprot:TRINITY_DN2428_c0_g1::TRINITY_DN2428_c0_g1_i1::g.8788::m.8788 TRINITY_DN2428_c0_g1::TRINITY_DN2428_c0_g1_i1::g.8788  ORF type:complete len:350 (+),score=80.80,sp/Q76NW7/HGH1_DICDI/26.91/5e-35,DUF383/PF04063.9/4.7e+02,DUF383/PF04063.9/8.9e-33,DUF384/PF04064.8/3.9e+02,DUF384/PF04064.8/5e+03,DUF384/PF04064.8/1.7e+03,DUF384/PF04064.8/3.4e+03,DUF384/PF04064.8/3.3e-09,Arm/PF00514.18/9.2,Arm/PF00514.18/1.1e+02,Arm/PF00514.18/6.8e+03 TRINITY_DN2428_c0_g1_i1:57-1052(+)